MRDDCDHSWSQYGFCVKCVFCVRCGCRCAHENPIFDPSFDLSYCMKCGTIVTPYRPAPPKEWSPKPWTVCRILRVLNNKGRMTAYGLNQELSKKFVGPKEYTPVLSSKSQLYKYLEYCLKHGLIRVVSSKPRRSYYGNQVRYYGLTRKGKLQARHEWVLLTE